MNSGRKRKVPYNYDPPKWDLSDDEPSDSVQHDDDLGQHDEHIQHQELLQANNDDHLESDTGSEMEVEPEPNYFSDYYEGNI